MTNFSKIRRQMAASMGVAGPTIFGFVVSTTTASEVWGLSITTDDEVVIDWGDTQSDTYTSSGVKTHTYTTAGTYTVTFAGTMSTFSCNTGGYQAKVVELLGLGADVSGLTSLNNSFGNCTRITNCFCPDSVLDMTFAYNGCSSLLYGKCGSNVTVLTYAFNNCGNMLTMECGDSVTTMPQSFNNCHSLTNMSIGPSVVTAGSAFGGSLGAATLDIRATEGVFTDANYCFNGCTGLYGPSFRFWDVWTTLPSAHYKFYGNCTGLDDYATIDAGWK